MPKVIPVPDALGQPFSDAVDERRPVLQHCAACASAERLLWQEVHGRGHIAAAIVIEDGRLERCVADQPFNLAMITPDEAPEMNFYANLSGAPINEVPVGAAVERIFEGVAPGQFIHDWRVVR